MVEFTGGSEIEGDAGALRHRKLGLAEPKKFAWFRTLIQGGVLHAH
jgi:hypothetical protein